MYRDPIGPGAVVTSTTARIHGVQDGRIDAGFARTPEAFVSVAWSGVVLRFRSANAAQGVLEGFAAARAHLIGLDHTVPLPADKADLEYAQSAVLLTWEHRTPYAVVRRDAYSESRRRMLHWVDLHMGPVTWQIVDRAGYDSAVHILRNAHRTAVAVCLDGGKFRADPTKDDYRSPDIDLLTQEPRGQKARKSKTNTQTEHPDSARTAELIDTATEPEHGRATGNGGSTNRASIEPSNPPPPAQNLDVGP